MNMFTYQKTVSNQIRNYCLDSASRAEQWATSMKNVKNAFFGKIKQFNKLKRKLYLFINSSDDAKILLSITGACPSE
jgi:hypothetical protein